MACNSTVTNQIKLVCLSYEVHMIFGGIGVILVILLSLNIFFCISKYCPGKKTCSKQRRSTRQMEDNPIYGNISYMQTSSTDMYTDDEHAHSSSMGDRQRRVSKPEVQDCYTNLTLKPPRVHAARSSPQIEYSDVVQIEATIESEKEDEGNADAMSTMSDLYSSVQTQRTKIVNTADTGEDYANHL